MGKIIRYNLPTLFMVGIFFAVVALLVVFPVRDYDTFWHVANGRAMVESGKIVNEEIFSYTAFGTHFHNHAWLSQIIFYLAYALGGAAGLVVSKVVLTLLLCVILFAVARQFGADPILAALLCLVMVIVGLSRFTVRPQLFSYLGMALLIYLLEGYRQGRWGWKSLAWIPPLMILWDFLHGAVYGLAFLGVFLMGETLKGRAPQPLREWAGATPLPPGRLKTLWLWSGITLAAMLVNPYGILTYDVFFNLVSGLTEAQSVGEFQPTTLQGYEAFWALLVLAGILLLRAGRRADITYVLVFAAFACLGIRYSRTVAVSAIAALPIAAAELSHLRQRLECRENRFFNYKFLLLLGTICCLGYVGYLKFYQPAETGPDVEYAGYEFGFGVNENFLPAGSVRFIKDVDLSGNMYNTDRFGGYLAYFLAPERKIFHYNHPSVFKGDLYRYVHDPEEREKWDMSYALIARKDEMQMFVREDWVPVYWEPSAMVLVKPTEANREIVARYGIQYFQPLMSDGRFVELAGNPAILPRLAQETADYLTYRHDRRLADLLGRMLARAGASMSNERQLTLLRTAAQTNGDSPWLLAAQGAALYRAGELAAARGNFHAALSLDAGLDDARLQLGYIAYDMKEYRQAATEFDGLLSRNPDNANALYGMALATMRLAQFPQSREYFERYLALVPRGPFAEKAKQFLLSMP